MNKNYTLFNLDELEKRKTSNQQEFEDKNFHLLTALPDMVKRSFERLNKEILAITEIVSREKNLSADAISGYLKGELIKAFPEYCGEATPSRFKLKSPNNGEWIYVKKLFKCKGGYTPKNGYSKNNEKIYNQRSDEPADISPNIFIGYVANDEMTDAIGVFAICKDGDEIKWVSDLSSLAAKQKTTMVMEVVKKETKLKDGLLKLKKKVN